jgi:hypothetical protein
MVWMKHLNSGFGDLLRGTISLYNLSRQLDFELIVDTQLHPVSKILIPHPHRYSNYVMENQSTILTNAIHMTEANVEQFIKSELRHGHDKPLMLVSNAFPDRSTSKDCKRFMRHLLKPTDEFKRYFNEMCHKFHITPNYSIAHFRLGDQDLIDNKVNIENYNSLCGMIDIQMAKTPNLYIMSDSLMFKKYLCKTLRPELVHRVIPTTPIHLAVPNADDIENIRETMFDFMLLTNARIIKTHSKYMWVSGFARWVSLIFNIPLVDMKPKMMMRLEVNARNAPPPIQPQSHNPIISSSLFRTRPVRTGSFRTMF